MRTRLLLSTIGVLLALPSPAPANDAHWPRFRGPGGRGVAPAADVPSTLAAANIRWSTQLPGSGHSSPVVWGRRVYLTGEDRAGERRCVVSLDTESGKVVWIKWFPCARYRMHRDNSFAAATPVADAEAVYVSWVTDGKVEALAMNHDGKAMWNRKLGRFQARHGPGASPMIVGDILVVTNDQESPDAAIHGLNRKSGATVWSIKRRESNPSYATPSPYLDAGGAKRLVIASPGHGLTAIDPANGKKIWEVGGLFTLNVVASPVVSNGHVFATAGWGSRREAAVVRIDDKGPARLLYRPEKDLPYVPTPFTAGAHVFLIDDRGTATCREMKTGKVLWRERVTGPTYSSPVSDGTRIFGISRKGELVVFKAAPEYVELGRYQLPEGTHATPALAHGALFVRTFNRLMRVGK